MHAYLRASILFEKGPAAHTSVVPDTFAASVEERRAREVDKLLGPKKSAEPVADFIFDLHNTTSITGTLLCFHPDDEFALRLAAHLHSQVTPHFPMYSGTARVASLSTPGTDCTCVRAHARRRYFAAGSYHSDVSVARW